VVITFEPFFQFKREAVVVLLTEEQVKNKNYPASFQAIKGEIGRLVQSGQFSAEKGELFPSLVNKKILLLVGLGKEKDVSLTALRITVRQAVLSSYLKKIRSLDILVHEEKDAVIKAVIEAVLIGCYSWKKYKSKPKDDKTIDDKQISVICPKKNTYEAAAKICEGVNLTRDLINDNADTVTADYFEQTIRSLLRGKRHVSLTVLNKRDLQAKGLGLHLAVNQGSRKEPKLIIVKYQGASAKEPFTALVGKGITFDTGGLNIKPTGSMETMRTDMSGAAAVVGTLKNVLALGLKKNIIFVCALAENAIGEGSYKPGDVFRSYSGKTVEIGNTDAEGRLVLADAISYVVKNYKPARLIDLATLTGACVIALGHDYAGLVVKDDEFSRQLVHSSNETDDRVWRLPIYPELKEAVKSQVADIKNVGWPKGTAGTLTAAEFLHQFSEGTNWAHLDIAGTAFVDGQGRWYYGHGATGFGVRLLTHFVQNY